MSNKTLDRNTLGYTPYHDECAEMGLSVAEYEYAMNHSEEDPKEFSRVEAIANQWIVDNDARILREQSEKLSKERSSASSKKTNSISKEFSHWYNSLPKEKVLMLIDNSRRFCDEYIDRSQLRESLERKLVYNEKLRERVKSGILEYRDSCGKNISRFPRYDAVNDKLVGSSFSFVTLWSHVFSLRR